MQLDQTISGPRGQPSEAERDPGAGGNLVALLSALLCTALVLAGWQLRHEHFFEAEAGTGYWLGVAGAAMMALLLLYSARKRIRALREAGPIRYWFRVHMWLGILGPIAILFHCNFSLGSLNSSVALVSMLLVAGSGVVGRFIYSQVHSSLYGHRVKLQDLERSLVEAEGQARPLLEAFPEALEPLRGFEARNTRPTASSIRAVARLMVLPFRARAIRREVLGLLPPVLAEEREASRLFIRNVRRTGQFVAYERIFRVWHAIHLPLFYMMVLTLAIHVAAVHMF